jgi:hypothetical protein
MANRLKFDEEKKKRFLELLKETANITKSCEAVGISHNCYRDHYKADAEFRELADEAYEYAGDLLEQEARRRAFEGVDKPVFYQGDVCGAIREYSDTLLIFLLKGAKPSKYAERVIHKIDPKEIDSLIEQELSKITRPDGDNTIPETTVH